MKKENYPSWVCIDCVKLVRGYLPNRISCWHIDPCGICGKLKPVTEPRDFGHFSDDEIKLMRKINVQEANDGNTVKD